LTAFAPPEPGLPAWAPVPGFTSRVALGGAGLRLQVPDGLGPLRVRVREVELVGADGGAPPPRTATADELTERVTFTDAVALETLR
ncbi:MAG: hypothetical protein M3336_12070, partial [Chloroflexota bacterium]|nr:hypothetical protein [Chloroflexota bacterium]